MTVRMSDAPDEPVSIGIAGARGHAIARVFTEDGLHVATVAQEGLGRARRG